MTDFKKIVLRNFPYSVQELDLHHICSHYGIIEKITLLSKKATAIIEYADEDSAHLAITHLDRVIIGGRRVKAYFYKENLGKDDRDDVFFIRPYSI